MGLTRKEQQETGLSNEHENRSPSHLLAWLPPETWELLGVDLDPSTRPPKSEVNYLQRHRSQIRAAIGVRMEIAQLEHMEEDIDNAMLLAELINQQTGARLTGNDVLGLGVNACLRELQHEFGAQDIAETANEWNEPPFTCFEDYEDDDYFQIADEDGDLKTVEAEEVDYKVTYDDEPEYEEEYDETPQEIIEKALAAVHENPNLNMEEEIEKLLAMSDTPSLFDEDEHSAPIIIGSRKAVALALGELRNKNNSNTAGHFTHEDSLKALKRIKKLKPSKMKRRKARVNVDDVEKPDDESLRVVYGDQLRAIRAARSQRA